MVALTQTCQELECDMDAQMQEKQKYKLEAKRYKGAVSVLTEQATKPPGKENHKKYTEVTNKLESALVARKTICSMAFHHNPSDDEAWENVVKEWQRAKAQDKEEESVKPSVTPPPYECVKEEKNGKRVCVSLRSGKKRGSEAASHLYTITLIYP
ncbi:unnamed protein product [Caretta caretta]